MPLELPYGLRRTTAGHDSEWTGPYADIAAANAAVPAAVRLERTVLIGKIEYWWKDGVADSSLVPKFPELLENLVLSNNDLILQQIDKIDTTSLGPYVSLGILGDLPPSNNFIFMFPSNSDPAILWHGTNGGGLWKIDFNTSLAEVFNAASGNYTGDLLVNDTQVGVIVDDEIFYAADSLAGGLIRFDTINNICTRYTSASGNYTGDLLLTTDIISIVADGDLIWITYPSAVYRFNKVTLVSTVYDALQANYTGSQLTAIIVKKVKVVGDNVWITHSTGLYRLNKTTSVMSKFTTISGGYTGDVLLTNNISEINFIGTDLYVGYASGTNGFFKLDTIGMVLTNFTPSSENYTGDAIVSNISSFIYNKDGMLYFGQAGNTWGMFDTVGLSFNHKKTLLNSEETMSGLKVLYHDAAELIFPATNIFISKDTGASGMLLIDTVASDIQLEYNEDGLRYITEPEGKLSLLSVAYKKYVDNKFSPLILSEYTVATVPGAADNKGGFIAVTDEAGGYVPAFSDGTNWRRVTDRAIIS